MRNEKNGRPRRVDIRSYPEATDERIGYAIAILDELSERVYDQISDLPVEALNFVPEGSYLSIGKVVLHQAMDEADCVSKITGRSVPEDLQDELSAGGKEDLDKPLAPPPKSAAELIALCKRIRQDFTKPSLSSVTDIDSSLDGQGVLDTARKQLMHLTWHWTFHSGHIGLTRLLWGSEYNWRY